MENTLKQKLAAGAQPIGTFFDTASVSLMECLGRTGLDFAIIDNEHSPIEAETTAALVRAAFLPMTAVCAFNSFFAHKLARSPLLRIRFPRGAQTPSACALCGAALIPIAFLSLHAFAPLLFASLLWLAAPPLFRARFAACAGSV